MCWTTGKQTNMIMRRVNRSKGGNWGKSVDRTRNTRMKKYAFVVEANVDKKLLVNNNPVAGKGKWSRYEGRFCTLVL